MPGVHAVLTAADVASVPWGRAIKDVPVLASDRVRFFGERVAAVAADDEDIAQQALDLIEVEYEELPAVFDVDRSDRRRRPRPAPRLRHVTPARGRSDKPTNAYSSAVNERGDVEAGFADADIVVENTYTTQRVHQAYLEPQASSSTSTTRPCTSGPAQGALRRPQRPRARDRGA